MNETSTEFADYEPPMLTQVGDFTEDTMGPSYSGTFDIFILWEY